jgi:hypothetical protein
MSSVESNNNKTTNSNDEKNKNLEKKPQINLQLFVVSFFLIKKFLFNFSPTIHLIQMNIH